MEAGSEQLIQRFKALADPVRLRLVALCAQGECSVSELTRVLALSQPRVSQHLRQLCDAGLLERFRDGHFVYYRVASGGGDAAGRRRLLSLIPGNEPQFARDARKLREQRHLEDADPVDARDGRKDDRLLHRALLELTVASPLGDLLDIGSGRGRVLKLLASRARTAVGVDTDADARRLARAELLLAGLPNCTLRQGDMYALPFEDGCFDTVVLDEVLAGAKRPVEAIAEAARCLRDSGRLIILATVPIERLPLEDAGKVANRLARWCRGAGLRLASPRSIPAAAPRWLLAIATHADSADTEPALSKPAEVAA